jgi:hypothetical protein
LRADDDDDEEEEVDEVAGDLKGAGELGSDDDVEEDRGGDVVVATD